MSWKFALLATAIAFAGCSGDPGAPTDDVRPPSDDVEDEDSTSAAADPCAKPTLSTVAKPVPLMSAEKLAQLGARLPCIKDKSLRRVLEHPDTIFYDKTTMIPGYQDSFGDNTQLPIGMRPNKIAPGAIERMLPSEQAILGAGLGKAGFDVKDWTAQYRQGGLGMDWAA